MVTELDKNTALILIDLQKGVVAMPMASPIAEVLSNCAKLAAAFRKANLPIVIVNVHPAGKWTATRKDASPASVTPRDDFFEIVPEIKTEPGDIFITKNTWNAFYNTWLHDELQKRSVTGVVIAGVSVSIGVEGTARSASEHGYNIAFALDAMTDMFAEARDRSIKYIFPRIGQTDSTDHIITKIGQ